MIYTYECETHGEFDRIMFISELRESLPCPECKKLSKKVIVKGHCGVHRKDSLWVKDVSKIFEIDGHRPMETIEDLRRFHAENPKLKPKESHPAFSSSLGDISVLPDKASIKGKVRKEANEWLRKDEALTVNSRTSV